MTTVIHNGSNIHLRDAQHAHLFFNSNDFDTAPKSKFLYHVLFELTTEAKTFFSIEDHNLKILSVLAKSASLPSYTSAVETLNQYNRKKNFQTKIEYKDVNISFYDDNVGISRSLLESYYRYYFTEANKNSHTEIDYRDKFSLNLPKYGLDNGTTKPYFEYIKIFQLSKQQWFCYTLVNPIIRQWSHDELAYAEGSATMENKISVAYEAVLYSKGNIDKTSVSSNPAGFGATWYDNTPSPLKNVSSTSINKINNFSSNTNNNNLLDQLSNAVTPVTQFTEAIPNPFSILKNIIIPKTDNQVAISSTSTSSSKQFDSAQLKTIMSNNQDLLDTLTSSALASGSYSPDWNSNNFSNFKNLDADTKKTIQNDIIEKLDSNVKIQQIASQIASA